MGAEHAGAAAAPAIAQAADCSACRFSALSGIGGPRRHEYTGRYDAREESETFSGHSSKLPGARRSAGSAESAGRAVAGSKEGSGNARHAGEAGLVVSASKWGGWK